MKTFFIGPKQYGVGKNKKTGKYVLIEAPKTRFEFDTFPELLKKVDKIKKNHDKKEFRSMIAEMSGTSYAAACRDVGMNPV